MLASENSLCINACSCFLLIYSGYSTSVFFYFNKISTEPQTSHPRTTGTAARSIFHKLQRSQTTEHRPGEGREGPGSDVTPLAGHRYHSTLSHTLSHLTWVRPFEVFGNWNYGNKPSQHHTDESQVLVLLIISSQFPKDG